MTNTRSYELPCYDNRKSFYGKAIIIEEDEIIKLQSYSTIVGYIKDGVFYRKWNSYSPTTMRHINSFLIHFSIDGGGKKWWDSLGVA